MIVRDFVCRNCRSDARWSLVATRRRRLREEVCGWPRRARRRRVRSLTGAVGEGPVCGTVIPRRSSQRGRLAPTARGVTHHLLPRQRRQLQPLEDVGDGSSDRGHAGDRHRRSTCLAHLVAARLLGHATPVEPRRDVSHRRRNVSNGMASGRRRRQRERCGQRRAEHDREPCEHRAAQHTRPQGLCKAPLDARQRFG